MLGFNRWHLVNFLAAILGTVGIVSLALIYFFPAPSSTITMAVGIKGGNYELLVVPYKEIIARHHVKLELRETAGGWGNVELLMDENSGVQATFVQGGTRSGEPAPGLLSLGRINYQIYCVFYRATEVLGDLTELKGKRIAVGPPSIGARQIVDKVLKVSGVTSENSTFLPVQGQAAVNATIDGSADAAVLGLASDSPLIQSLLRDPRVRLMSVTDAEALTRLFPFLTRMVFPRGVIDFEKKIPAGDIVLFASTNSVLIRNDLHPAHIRLLAQALLETHRAPGLFQRAGEFPIPTDTEFPMAEGAIEFYKNGPSFLDRYLPFWITNYAKRFIALMATVIVIVLPIFNLAPKLYRWLVEYRLGSIYLRLREIEANLQKDVTIAEVSALEAELASVNRAIHLLGVPKQHSDLFFSIKSHLNLVRINLGLRRAELQSRRPKAV
jgi:TRAP-type uncharacterized transport system substrate-binding protein